MVGGGGGGGGVGGGGGGGEAAGGGDGLDSSSYVANALLMMSGWGVTMSWNASGTNGRMALNRYSRRFFGRPGGRVACGGPPGRCCGALNKVHDCQGPQLRPANCTTPGCSAVNLKY